MISPTHLGQPWDAVLTISLILTAITIILKTVPLAWRKLVIPAARSINQVDATSQAMPVLLSLAEIAPALREVAALAPFIREIRAELRPNGGSTMRDLLNRLESASQKNADAIVLAAEATEKNAEAIVKATATAAAAQKASGTAIREARAARKATHQALEVLAERVERRKPESQVWVKEDRRHEL